MEADFRSLLLAAVTSIAMLVQLPLALSQEKERSATVGSGETVRIWFGANYGRRCATAGPPIFNLISKHLSARYQQSWRTTPCQPDRTAQVELTRVFEFGTKPDRSSGPTRLSTPSSFPTSRQIQRRRKVHNPLVSPLWSNEGDHTGNGA
jgi:hypothetical protein